MAKKSLIIHDLDRLDLKYLPTIIDIVTVDTKGSYDNHHLFLAARAFIDALALYEYNPRTAEDREAITKFIEVTEELLAQLKKDLS